MKDWKGNEVKAGDTVVRIRIQDDHSSYPTGFFMLTRDNEGRFIKSHETKLEVPPEREYLWEEVERYTVFEQEIECDGRVIRYLAMEWKMNDERICIMPIDDPFGEPVTKPRIINCIAGKSDDRDEYYLNHFRA